MVESSQESTEIKDTDIVFDCPHCGKSLAIDYRGAGLTIPCTDCGSKVEVPIPDGMELTDIDSSEEEQEMRILNLRRLLGAAEYRIQELKAEVDELKSRRENLERGRTDSMYRLAGVLEKAGVIEQSLGDIKRTLEEISELSRPEPAGSD